MSTVCFLRSNPVDPDSRVEKETVSLANNGYNIIILSWDRNNDYREKQSFLFGRSDICIFRFGIKASYGGGFKNILKFLKFQKRMRQWLRHNRKKYDFIHACDYDTAISTIGIAKRLKKRFIFDIFDFKYGAPKRFYQKIVRKLQYDVINKADATILCTEKRLKQIQGSSPKKIVYIHNSPQQPTTFLSVIKSKSNKNRIVYVGILDERQRMLKEIINIVKNMKDVEFHIGGFGPLEEYVKKEANLSPNIIFYGRISYLETLSLEAECDILTAIYNPKIENSRYAAPNKFYEALMLGKPLIMIKETGMSEVVESNKIGAVVDCNESAIRQGLVELIERKNEWIVISEKNKRLYEQNYSWNEMENRLLNLYRELAVDKLMIDDK